MIELNLIELAEKLSDVRTKRYPLLKQINYVIANYSYDLNKIFLFIKARNKNSHTKGFLIQCFVPISTIQPLHRDKISNFLKDYCKVNPFHKEKEVWEAIIFFFFALDRKFLINLNFANPEMSHLKSDFLFNVKNPEIKFIIPADNYCKYKQGLSFSHILKSLIQSGDLELFNKFHSFITFSYKFPLLNSLSFLFKWVELKENVNIDLFLSPDVFVFDKKYIVFDPKERAKVERFITDKDFLQETISKIKSKNIETKKILLQKEFINNFLSIADIYTDTGSCFYGFDGEVYFNKMISEVFNLNSENSFFENLINNFKSNQETTKRYLINGINTEVKISEVIKNKLNIGYLILFKDITEEELFNKFSGHDIKNSIISIVSTFELLKDNKEIGEEDKQLISSGEKSITNLREKFNDFFSLRSNKLDKKMCDLNFLLHKTIFALTSVAEKKKIKIDFLEDTNSDIELNLDSKKIYRVFENILSNSIKYSPNNTLITLLIEKKENYVLIKFIDEGYGISQEYGENIFDIGVRQETHNLHKKVTGSGIGLAVVKRFVTMHKGHIFYKANEEKGTTFTVKLPIDN